MDRSIAERHLKTRKLSPATVSQFNKAVALLQQAYAAEIAKWQGEYGEPFPQTLEDWQRWLAEIDAPGRFLPADRTASGNWTGADILPYIEGYLRRLRDAKPAAEPESPDSGEQPKATIAARMIDLIKKPHTHTWTVRQFATKLGCSVGAVQGTAAWKQLAASREMARQERSGTAYRRNRDSGCSQ